MKSISITKSPALLAGFGILAVFFMPWVNVDMDLASSVQSFGSRVDKLAGSSGAISKMTDKLGGALSKQPVKARLASVSGFDIANSGKSEFAALVGDLMIFAGQDSKDPRNVKYLYLIPILGFLLGAAIHKVPAKSLAPKVIGGVSVAIGGFMAFKLATVPLQNELAQAELLWGIWATALLYIVVGYFGLTGSKKKKARK